MPWVLPFALEPASTATTLRGDVVTDEHSQVTKEVVVGFYVIEAPHLDAALELVPNNPILHDGGGVEVRPMAGGEVHPPAGR